MPDKIGVVPMKNICANYSLYVLLYDITQEESSAFSEWVQPKGARTESMWQRETEW